jgi:hypothetical protein
LQDAILQLGDVTSTALAKAAAIAQAATEAESRAHPGQGRNQDLQARTDRKVKGQVVKLNVLKTEKYITFPDNLSPVELVSCEKIACTTCDHTFKVGQGMTSKTSCATAVVTAVVTLLSCPSPQI